MQRPLASIAAALPETKADSNMDDKVSDALDKDNCPICGDHHGDLVRLANDMSMSFHDIVLLKSAFEAHDANNSGSLDPQQFQKAVQELLRLQGCVTDLTQDSLRAMMESHLRTAAADSDAICFKTFVRWYCFYGFCEDLLITWDEQWTRKVAKEHGVSHDYVIRVKDMFDSCRKGGNSGNSGGINFEEFSQILYMLMKVPQHVGLPTSCVRYFWSQIDVDQSGKASLNGFLYWWLKHFDEGASQNEEHVPFESYYKHVRRIGYRFLDPPAYPPLKCINN